MFLFDKIGFMCMIISCFSPVFAETEKKHTSTAGSSNSSTTGYSSNFNKENQNDMAYEYVKELNVGQKWKSMETTAIKILTRLYNESIPFMTQVNKELDISSTCKRDLMEMLSGIKEFKHWAVQMLDSFGKIPIGMEKGTLNALGDFDQCLDVVVPGHFQGQYCNLDLVFPFPNNHSYFTSETDIPEVRRAVRPGGYFEVVSKAGRYLHFLTPRVSICVPSTCSRDELQKIANKAVQTMDLMLELQIPNCEILNKEIKFDRSQIAVMVILGVLLLLVLIATAVDIYLKTKSKEEENYKQNLSLRTKYLLCFSAYTNAQLLLRPDTEKDSIKIFHGIRFFTTLWVIMVHSCIYQNFKASGLLLNLYKFLQKIPFQFIANGFINVQIFFFMSGTLHAITILKKKEKINIPKHIFRRIWRLAPAFMLVIGCVIVLPHAGSGPVWKETMEGLLTDKCRETWWTNFLFINNLFRSERMCLQWLWYIPVDFQLYVLSLLALIPMKKNPALGLTINFFIMICAMVISAALHVYYNLTPILVFAFTNPKDIGYFLERGYFRTYLHCSSVCIGIAVGYFFLNRPPKLRIPWKTSAPLWLTSLTICSAVIFGVHRWNAGFVPSIGISVLYAGGSKLLWALAMAWLTIACVTGNGGIVNKILSLPIFVPLGRLCYMVYLIHSVIHYMYVGSSRISLRAEPRTIIYMYCATVLISFLCASILTLVFESPFLALDKLMFDEKSSQRIKRPKTLDSEKSEEESLKNGDIVKDMENVKKVA